MGVDVRSLKYDIIEDDYEQIFGDSGGLVEQKHVEGYGDEEVQLHVDKNTGD